ncbi:diguanylate cyclase [Desulfosporosinus sp. FKB]|uniref:diguanylate cyclase domain-containing protein n=1 Tax=Desulfosporosinus sp. FKB TaxID=1969835 RepID=UPI000B4A4ED7
MIGRTATEVFPNIDQSFIEISGRLALTGEPSSLNTFFQALNKSYEIRVYSLSDNEFATIYIDNTERLKNERDIQYFTYHDVLTGLYNRRFYEEKVRKLNTERNFPISLIIGDVNGLKLINDVFGHLKGDELLQKAALAIRNSCRSDEIIARWGGDEFVILLPKTTCGSQRF